MKNWWKDQKTLFQIGIGSSMGIGILLLILLSTGIGLQWEKIDLGYLGYQRIIFIGDSRTAAMEDNNPYKDIDFVAARGEGLRWFKEEGYAQLMEILERNNTPQPIALVFNLGVNDYKSNSEKYISYFQEIAQTLRDQNCYLFYMSINPVEEEKLRGNTGYTMRTNKGIQTFNQRLKDGLEGEYFWLDMNTALKNKGFSTTDGLHYSDAATGYILAQGIRMVVDAECYPQEYCWRRREGNWYALGWEDDRAVKNMWIRDGEGEFYLDEDGQLLRNQKIMDEEGNMVTVGNSGRKMKISTGSEEVAVMGRETLIHHAERNLR